ncbi:hypothetical protein TB2_006540 [Malus domestica]
MSMMVGVIRPKGRIMVLVAEHQKLRAAIRSSLSMAISMVESLMASWMPRASHSLPKNLSIRSTQVALVEGRLPGASLGTISTNQTLTAKGVRQWSLKRLVMDDGIASLKSSPKI